MFRRCRMRWWCISTKLQQKTFFFLLFFVTRLLLSRRPIPTRLESTRPTSAPQRCWAVARRPEAGALSSSAPRATRQPALTCFHHGIDLLGLHTCTYHLPFLHLNVVLCRLSSFFKMIVLVQRWFLILRISFFPKVVYSADLMAL